MAKISFKAYPKYVYNTDGFVDYSIVSVPKFTRSHCDMSEFRAHPKYRGLANSDLFPNLLLRIRKDVFLGRDSFRLDAIPPNVQVDISGFLVVVSFEV